VIYDESSRALPVRELAALSFRRAMEAARLAVLSAGLALAIVLPMRINVMPELKLIVFSIPPAILLPVAALLFWLRRSPPAAAIERYSKAIEARRRKGLPVGAMSRSFMALTGVLAFAFAIGLLMIIPIV
jgi:hypothetical protein